MDDGQTPADKATGQFPSQTQPPGGRLALVSLVIKYPGKLGGLRDRGGSLDCSGQDALRIRVCRDKTLASETILYVRVCGRDYYGWLDGSPAIGYRIHFSGSLFKDWWQVDRRGFYSRASYRRLPSETWGSVEPGSAGPAGPLDVVDFSQPGSPDSSWLG